MKTITIQVPNGCEVQIIKKKEKKEPVIRTYQDLIDTGKTINTGYWIGEKASINEVVCYTINQEQDKNIAASEKVAKSMLAMAMISQLMPYYGGQITDEEWEDAEVLKYVINRYKKEIRVVSFNVVHHFLAFHTIEQRDNFLKYNEQLVKDYLMID